jgi:hypothetical protein
MNKFSSLTSVVDAQPLAATVEFLTAQSSRKLCFKPSRLLLSSSAQPSEQAQNYLYQIAKDAQAAAFRLSCSSILVGQGNESDENSDVAFWVGQGEFEAAENVLQALGLWGWVRDVRACLLLHVVIALSPHISIDRTSGTFAFSGA